MKLPEEIVASDLIYSPVRLFRAGVRSIRFWFLAVVAGYVLSRLVDLPEDVKSIIHIVFVICCFLQIGITANVLMGESLDQFIRKKAESNTGWRTAQGLIQFALQAILWSLLLLLALDNLGVDITALVTGLGIGGIAAALAINNILQDLFASLSIILDKPFEAGDFIVIGDMSGTVERIGIKSTRIKSISGEQIVFANSDLLGSRVKNYKRMQERRIVFNFRIVYDTPIEKLKQIPRWIEEIVTAEPNTRFDRAHLKSLGSYAFEYEVVFIMLVPAFNPYMDVQQNINLRMLQKFEQEGIELAYPTQVEYQRKKQPDVDGQDSELTANER